MVRSMFIVDSFLSRKPVLVVLPGIILALLGVCVWCRPLASLGSPTFARTLPPVGSVVEPCLSYRGVTLCPVCPVFGQGFSLLSQQKVMCTSGTEGTDIYIYLLFNRTVRNSL